MLLHLEKAETFAYDSFYSVSVYSARDLLFCYCKSQPGLMAGMLTHQHRKIVVG